MSEQNEMDSIVTAARESVEIETRIHDYNGIPISIGNVQVNERLLAAMESREDRPQRREGTTALYELDSFILHVNRFKEPATVVYASSCSETFTAVYDEVPEGQKHEESAWRQFRATYSCPISPEWREWRDHSGIEMTQEVFADWLDERMDDLASSEDGPEPIEMLEMARSLQIYTKGTFIKEINPENGTSMMVCKEEQSAESTKIHRSFFCGLRIFEGGALYSVEMRVKFKLAEGRPKFSYSIHREEELVSDAFMEMRVKIEEETERPVFAGSAE